MLTLADALQALTSTRPEAPQAIVGGTVDSRAVEPGSLFVAMRGERTDGHQYVDQAFRSGAVVALIEHPIATDAPVLDLRTGHAIGSLPSNGGPLCLLVDNTLEALQRIARFWRSRLDLRVIGITGSVGKSTTKELVAQVLREKFRTLKSAGNQNNEIGLPLALLKLGKGHERAVLEMGFYVPGEIALLCQIAKPQIGVVTNVGWVHAERAGSREAIALGKRELVEHLPPAPEGVAILNFDDALVRQMAAHTKARILSYGEHQDADLRVNATEWLGLQGVRCTLQYAGKEASIESPVVGRQSVSTILRATAVGLSEGLSWDEIRAGLAQTQTPLRMGAVRSSSGAILLDDTYNASTESMLASLELLSDIQLGRKIAVLGDMLELGSYEQEAHQKVGQAAAQHADILLTLGPRAEMYSAAARAEGMKPERIRSFAAASEVRDWLHGNLKSSDVVLVKGSHGLHMERIVRELEVFA